MRLSCLLLAVLASSALATETVAQQKARPRIWDIALASPVNLLPDREFVDPACGTNGGPPGLVLRSFSEFNRCPVEQSTGLHEVWFTYDDEDEYIYRAHGDPIGAALRAHNVVLGQPVILSLLIDEDGLVQGYRIVTDSRADPDTRIDSYALAGLLRSRFGDDGWTCTELPPAAGERPISGLFVKERCEQTSANRRVTLESRFYYRPGQDGQVNPYLADTVNVFESSARLEVMLRSTR